ncbi:hypothetical protein FRC07_003361 [Ceratobasidium sp. 392]|nr:hypothetical protein FRC07_003361 [Ceratobasidium sp. 392]
MGRTRATRTQVNGRKAIPVLRHQDLAHRSLYQRTQRALASARHVTVVCGAGISTSAGIPDFRSPNGLYNGGRPDLPEGMTASELFDLGTLRDAERRRASGRFMARSRIYARSAKKTAGHAAITRLFDEGRLVRCYTQNIDGLQTRERSDMCDKVLELHGSNVRLLCHICRSPPIEDLATLDDRLIRDGEVRCTKCRSSTLGTEWEARLRTSISGYLTPDIVYNQDSREHGLEDMSLEEMEEVDAHVDLLLIIGTSLATEGAAKLTKSLAKNVHENGGVVVYVDRGRLPDGKWSGSVDLQIDIDIETWAADLLRLLDWVVASAKILSEQNREVQGEARPEFQQGSIEGRPVRTPRARRASDCEDPALGSARLMFLACHSGSLSSLASSVATRVALACYERGWEVREHGLLSSSAAHQPDDSAEATR